MQLPGLRMRGMLFGWLFQPTHPGVKRIGRLMVPSLLGLSVTQINITVSTILASFFSGGPTYLFYGMRLIQFPLGIFGVALATAILPTLSAQAARGALDELRITLGFGLRMISFIILPAMLGLIFLRQPIVHLFFEHGSFTSGGYSRDRDGGAVLCGGPLGICRCADHCGRRTIRCRIRRRRRSLRLVRSAAPTSCSRWCSWLVEARDWHWPRHWRR